MHTDPMPEQAQVRYLELLAREAAAIEFEAPVLEARARGASARTVAALDEAKAVALRVRAILESRRRRESELAALYETASDLSALNQLDDVLSAIVRRAKQLLHSDVSYLSLNDDEAGDTYMRVTDGIMAASFKQVRLPMGAGLGGLVAQTATAYATPSYFEDERFRHTAGIDSAVAEEGLVSILGVPLLLGQRVIGVLYAANRSERPFTRDDTALLLSLAAHAAVAIDNARLLAETQQALAEVETASTLLRAHTAGIERAADAHDRLAEVVLRGGGADDVARETAEVLGGEVLLLDDHLAPLASTGDAEPSPAALVAAKQAVATRRTADHDGVLAAPVTAGGQVLGAVVLRTGHVNDGDRRILERAALVTALLLLIRRSVADAEARVRGELLDDLLSHALTPAELDERARHLGADLGRPHAVVVAEVVGDRDRAAGAASFLASTRHGFSGLRQGRIAVVLPELEPRQAAQLVADEVRRATGEATTAGAAGRATGAEEIAEAHGEATRVLDALLALGRGGDVAAAQDLGFVGLLLGDGTDVGRYVATTLGPVQEYDDRRGTRLEETLVAYFENGRSIGRTATALHLHVNTVTQRLDRVTQLLGADWHDAERQLEVQLALRLSRLCRS